MLMTYIWLVILATLVIGVLLLLRQQQAKPSLPGVRLPKPRLQPTLFTLEIGDIVQYLETDWVVEGKLTYDDRGYTWLEYLLQDGDRRQWLSVDEDDTVTIALLEPTTELEVGINPPRQLTFAHHIYVLVESGTAQMTRTGSTLNRQAEHCHYFDYKGPDDHVLSIENWDGDLEVTVGYQIEPTLLRFLPGEGQSIYHP